jgi:O-antigen/teichoic acid export membrane protein
MPGHETGDATRSSSFAATAAATYGTNLAVAVLSLLNVLVTARTLGPAGRGELALLTTIAILTANLAAFGLYEANANIGGAEPQHRGSLAANSVLIALLLGGTAAGIVALLVGLFPSLGGEARTAVLVLALCAIPILILQSSLQTLLQSQYGFAITNVAWLLAPVTNLAVNGVFAALGLLTVGTAVVVWVAGQLLATGLLAWHAIRPLKEVPRPDTQLARRSLAFGARTHLGRVMTMGNYRLDQWFVGAISGSRELGLYSVAVAWAEALFYLPTALGMVQRPDLVRASRSDAGAQAARVFRATLLLTVLLALGLVVAAQILCVTVFGEEFRGSIADLRILAFGAFGIVALKLLGSALNAQGKPMLANVGVGIAFVATVVLDLLLIPGHGGLGAAIASTVAYTAGGMGIALVFARALGRSPRELIPRGHEVGPLLRQLRTLVART